MLKLEWLNKDNIEIIKEISFNEFKTDMENVGDLNLYDDVLNGETFNNIDINYALIKDDTENIGVIGYYIPKDDPKAVWLGWFAIKEKLQHKNYGTEGLKLLIDYVKNKYPNLEVCRTYTGLEKESAVAFYKKFGFIQEKEAYKLVSDNENTVIFNYPLNSDGRYKEWNQIPLW